jgi:hypothetical protein
LFLGKVKVPKDLEKGDLAVDEANRWVEDQDEERHQTTDSTEDFVDRDYFSGLNDVLRRLEEVGTIEDLVSVCFIGLAEVTCGILEKYKWLANPPWTLREINELKLGTWLIDFEPP